MNNWGRNRVECLCFPCFFLRTFKSMMSATYCKFFSQVIDDVKILDKPPQEDPPPVATTAVAAAPNGVHPSPSNSWDPSRQLGGTGVPGAPEGGGAFMGAQASAIRASGVAMPPSLPRKSPAKPPQSSPMRGSPASVARGMGPRRGMGSSMVNRVSSAGATRGRGGAPGGRGGPAAARGAAGRAVAVRGSPLKPAATARGGPSMRSRGARGVAPSGRGGNTAGAQAIGALPPIQQKASPASKQRPGQSAVAGGTPVLPPNISVARTPGKGPAAMSAGIGTGTNQVQSYQQRQGGGGGPQQQHFQNLQQQQFQQQQYSQQAGGVPVGAVQQQYQQMGGNGSSWKPGGAMGGSHTNSPYFMAAYGQQQQQTQQQQQPQVQCDAILCVSLSCKFGYGFLYAI